MNARKRARGDRDVPAKHRWEEDEDTEAARAEAARLRDQQEKEEFEERLRLRDDAKTVKLASEPQLSKAQREEAERRAKAEDAKDLVPVLREVSRQEYLKKREKQKLDELKEAIEARLRSLAFEE